MGADDIPADCTTEVREAWALFDAVQILWASRGHSADEVQQRLIQESDRITAQTKRAMADVPDPTIRKAILLLTHRDLLDAGLKCSLSVLQDKEEDTVVADVLSLLAAGYGKVCQSWRQVLEARDDESRAHIAEQSEHIASTRAATGELVTMSERLHRDCVDLAKQNKQLQLEVRDLRSANERLTADLNRFFKRTGSVARPASAGPSCPITQTPAAQSGTGGRRRSASGGATMMGPPGAVVAAVRGNGKLGSGEASVSANKKLRSSSTHSASPGTGKAPGKVMTLQALRDFIDELFASKQKADVNCAKSRLPRETLGQHLYTFLNHRFGLKSIVQEWLQSVQTAVAAHKAAEHDIELFNKVLSNTVNEEFWLAQQSLQHAILDALKAHIQKQAPTLSEDALTAALNSRVMGYVSGEEWGAVLDTVYPTKEGTRLAPQLRALSAQGGDEAARHRPAEPCPHPPSSHPLVFYDFMQYLLKYHLGRHEKALRPIVDAFNDVEQSGCGYLSHEQFIRFCRIINSTITDKEVSVLLHAMDPHHTQRVTFSSCAFTLSKELTRIMDAMK